MLFYPPFPILLSILCKVLRTHIYINYIGLSLLSQVTDILSNVNLMLPFFTFYFKEAKKHNFRASPTL